MGILKYWNQKVYNLWYWFHVFFFIVAKKNPMDFILLDSCRSVIQFLAAIILTMNDFRLKIAIWVNNNMVDWE